MGIDPKLIEMLPRENERIFTEVEAYIYIKTKEIAKKMVEHLDDLISPSFETTNGIGDIYTPWCLYAYKVWKDML